MAESVVLRVGESIQPLPQRLWRDPRFPDYGRAVVIAATPTMRLTPGELVNVKFGSAALTLGARLTGQPSAGYQPFQKNRDRRR